nr:hypothetical protein GCM10025730_40880 [Promicromonospora thailandica]
MKQPLRRLSQGAKRRVRQRLIESLKGGPRTQRTNREFTALVRDLAVFAADLSASATTRHELVVQTVVAFQARVTVAEARAGAALDMSLDRRAWHTDAPVVESLTDVARQLVGLDDQLALRAASCVLEARPGDERARAVQRDVAGSTRPTAGEEPWRVTARKRSQDTRIASALRDLAAGSADELSTNAAAELAAAYHGDAAASKPYLAVLRGTVAHSVAVGSPVAVLRGVLDATVAEMGAGVWERGTRWAGEPPPSVPPTCPGCASTSQASGSVSSGTPPGPWASTGPRSTVTTW